MTKRTTSLHFPAGTTSVGTATVAAEHLDVPTPQREIFKRTGNLPERDDEVFGEPAYVPAPIRRVKFSVAGVPVAKGRPRAASTPTGIRMHTPKTTVAYERKVTATAIVAMNGLGPFRRPIKLNVEIVLPIPSSWSKKRQTLARIGVICATKKPDADNVLKTIKDAMNGVVYIDDAQVVSIVLNKVYGEIPRAEVEVSEIDGEAA